MAKTKKKTIAIIGTVGLPAKYGGYETLTHYLTLYLNDTYNFIVYCSSIPKKNRAKSHNNARLIYIPFKANGFQSILYDSLSLIHAAFKSDVLLYLGPSAGFLIPVIKLFKKKIIVNHGGLNEWERTKYSRFQRFVAKTGHKYAAKYSHQNITDNKLLQNSLKKCFNANSVVIRYGGNHAKHVNIDSELLEKYSFLSSIYFINISRAQVDNNLHIVLKSFSLSPNNKLVMISNWNVSQYGIDLKKQYINKYPNIILLDAIYELKELNAIRSNARAYIHSHSYCGTAPSLVEAMSLGIPIISYDVPTNRETTKNKAIYFKNENELTIILESNNSILTNNLGKEMKKIANSDYTWSHISSEYKSIIG